MRVLQREIHNLDGERQGARGENIHDAEVTEARLVVEVFVEVAGHPARGDPGVRLRGAAGADDFPGGEHGSGGVRFADLHCYHLTEEGEGPAQTE